MNVQKKKINNGKTPITITMQVVIVLTLLSLCTVLLQSCTLARPEEDVTQRILKPNEKTTFGFWVQIEDMYSSTHSDVADPQGFRSKDEIFASMTEWVDNKGTSCSRLDGDSAQYLYDVVITDNLDANDETHKSAISGTVFLNYDPQKHYLSANLIPLKSDEKGVLKADFEGGRTMMEFNEGDGGGGSSLSITDTSTIIRTFGAKKKTVETGRECSVTFKVVQPLRHMKFRFLDKNFKRISEQEFDLETAVDDQKIYVPEGCVFVLIEEEKRTPTGDSVVTDYTIYPRSRLALQDTEDPDSEESRTLTHQYFTKQNAFIVARNNLRLVFS